jgi:hypothetical protein
MELIAVVKSFIILAPEGPQKELIEHTKINYLVLENYLISKGKILIKNEM